MRDGIIARKTKIVIEPHDIDTEPEQRFAICESANIPAQVCNLITLVL